MAVQAHETDHPAFAAYRVPLVDRQGWLCIDPVAANAMSARIAAEIEALTQCSPKVAMMAAGAFVNMRTAPGYGLDAMACNDPGSAYRAQTVLTAWMTAKLQAFEAAEIAKRVAA